MLLICSLVGGVQNHNSFVLPVILDEIFVLIQNLKTVFTLGQYSAGYLGRKSAKIVEFIKHFLSLNNQPNIDIE